MGGIAPSEAVQIGGKSLGSIYDIVKTATGSDFPEIPKHSLLIFERHPNGNSFRMDDTNGDFYFKFFDFDRNETGYISRNILRAEGGNSGNTYDDTNGWKVWGYGHGVSGCEIAAGDIDGDGYKNEIALTWTQSDGTWMYVYKVTKSGSGVKVTRLHEEIIHAGYSGTTMGYQQACPNVVVGDFDADGRDEAAFVGRVFPGGSNWDTNHMRVSILDYDGRNWNYDGTSIATYPGSSSSDGAHAPCQATRCDFDGDGKDEIAILFFPEQGAGTTYPRLERWYCDNGSIVPKRDTSHIKGGRGDTSLLGYTVSHTNSYYMMPEEFCITAGPLTGTKGKAKLAEDIAISHINDSRNSVYVIPTVLDSSKNFAGFGSTKTVFNATNSNKGRRGAIITADFANETLRLSEPSHTMDDNDESYVTILQAMPYHVDNVDINGNLRSDLINYTFSGFKGDADRNGEMSVSYTRTDKQTTKNDVSFNMASTTETIALLGDAGPYVHDYLKFRTMQANIAGNFDSRAKAAADTMNMIMDFVTDKIDTTDTNSTIQANQKETTQVDEALLWDKVISYSAQQHIWRYKILNDPLSSWYRLGAKVDNISKDLKPESQERYLTFSMYDDATKTDVDTHSTNTYQARHEEGNFFSYPSGVSQIPGYTKNEALANEQWVAWSKGSRTSTTISFAQEKISSHSLEEKIQESELNKTVSAIAALFGADDPNPLPPYTGHSETFTKSLETAEAVSIALYGSSTVPGEHAGHQILSMPFVAREGTLKVAHAVKLADGTIDRQTSLLWGDNSRYRLHPDPSLVLPKKFVRTGSSLAATPNNASAMQMRGLRFRVPEIDLLSDTHLVAGLTYEIKVPIYNASFKSTGSFDVKLSYANASEFSISAPYTTMDKLHEIQTITMNLKGWGDNKGWAVFTWTIPEGMVNGEYIFFVQIDPANDLKNEVHESRLNYNTGEIIDVGGNNEGYFAFNITSKNEVTKKHAKAAAIMAGEYRPEHSDGDTYYPEVYLHGINLKPGARERLVSENARVPQREDIGSVFCEHRMALVPNTTVDFMLDLSPRALDWENGSAFEFYVPELAAASVLAEIAESTAGEDQSGEDSSGEDSSVETPTTDTVGSSGGGCETFSLGLLGLAALAFIQRRKH